MFFLVLLNQHSGFNANPEIYNHLDFLLAYDPNAYERILHANLHLRVK